MDLFSAIKQHYKTFIIAEIGQNHQGSVDVAMQLIEIAKKCGADCVKFQKTCLEEKFTKSALEAPYTGPHSWGETYGTHKSYLEFSEKDFLQLQTYAEKLGILFTASAMDEKSLDFLISIRVPFIKIGSGDSNNFLLIEKAAKSGIPLIISTGMVNFDSVERIYNLVSKYHKNFALLHCVSSYPTPYEDINLKVIPEYLNKFQDIIVGYSGHELGIHLSVAAVALGAKIVERHFTLDKNQKGSDHKCSLEPKELKTMITQIRSLELALGQPLKRVQKSEKNCIEKLGKSLVYSRDLAKGHLIKEDDFKIKVSIPKGHDALDFERICGKVLIRSVKMDDPIELAHFKISN